MIFIALLNQATNSTCITAVKPERCRAAEQLGRSLSCFRCFGHVGPDQELTLPSPLWKWNCQRARERGEEGGERTKEREREREREKIHKKSLGHSVNWQCSCKVWHFLTTDILRRAPLDSFALLLPTTDNALGCFWLARFNSVPRWRLFRMNGNRMTRKYKPS